MTGRPRVAVPTESVVLSAPVLLQSENVASSATELTPPAGANFLLVLSLAGDGGGDTIADAVEWDGNSLTEIAAAKATGSGFEACNAYYLPDPDLAPADITFSGETGNHQLLVYWLSGVDTDDPVRDAGVTNTVDVTEIDVTGVASSLTDLTLSGAALSNTTGYTAGLGLTRDQHIAGGGGTLAGGYEAGVDGDASVRWTAGVSGRLAGNLVSIKGAPIVRSTRGYTGGPPVPYLIEDLFADTEAVILPNHTPDVDSEGGGWKNPTGTWDIRGNKGSISAGVGGLNAVEIDAGQADVILTCTMNTGDAKYPGVHFRASSVTDNILAHLSIDEDKIQVFKNVLGSRTEIANVAVTVDASTEYEWKVTLSGSSVKIEIDGNELVDIVETHNQTDTGVGLWQWDGNIYNGARWDDFRVEAN